MDAKRLVNKVGPWVEGDDFWDRCPEMARFLEWLDEGHHLLLVAPRRVGKTSLLREALRRLHERDQAYGFFVDLQGCKSAEDAVVAISMATRRHATTWRKTVEVFRSFFGSVADRIDTVGTDFIELKLREGTANAWRQRGNRILANLSQCDRPAVLCLDELPVMLMRMMRGDDSELTPTGIRDADLFMSWLRSVAHEHQGQVRLVVCGSIGLEPVLHRAGLSHTIGHLRAFPLEAWSRETATGCLEALGANYDLELSEEVRDAILDRLTWLVPHHVQMFFGHVYEDCKGRDASRATCEDIARVYTTRMLGPRGHADLVDYEERLLRVLGADLTPLALELLTEASVVGRVTPGAAVALAGRAGSGEKAVSSQLRAVMDVLIHDGYLVTRSDGSHEFVSGLVRDWWHLRFGQGHVPVSARRKG